MTEDKVRIIDLTKDTDYLLFHDTLMPQRPSSDKEVMPDDLSDEQGEGHGGSKKGKKASLFGSAMNISNTVMGAGVLALPNVLQQFGVLLGSTIIILSCIMVYISCVLLLKSRNLSHHSKYNSIGEYCFGSVGLWAVKAIIIVNNTGLCIAYLIIFSTVGENLLQGFVSECEEGPGAVYCEKWFLKLIAAVLIMPFIFAKSMAKLQGASVLGVLAACIFCIITIENYIVSLVNDKHAKEVHILPFIHDIPRALASITAVFLAFTFQFNFFPIYKTLKNPSDNRMKGTVSLGLTLVLVVYLSVANCGYLTFGEDTTDFLENFSKEKLGIVKFLIVNIAFLISSTLTFPLMFFGARNEIYGGIKIIRKKLSNRQRPQELEQTENGLNNKEEDWEMQGWAYKCYILILFGIIVLLAIAVPDIEEVFSFVGSTAANGLSFLLPSLFYLKLASKYGKLRKVAIVLLSIGSVVGVIGIVSATITAFNE